MRYWHVCAWAQGHIYWCCPWWLSQIIRTPVSSAVDSKFCCWLVMFLCFSKNKILILENPMLKCVGFCSLLIVLCLSSFSLNTFGFGRTVQLIHTAVLRLTLKYTHTIHTHCSLIFLLRPVDRNLHAKEDGMCVRVQELERIREEALRTIGLASSTICCHNFCLDLTWNDIPFQSLLCVCVFSSFKFIFMLHICTTRPKSSSNCKIFEICRICISDKR